MAAGTTITVGVTAVAAYLFYLLVKAAGRGSASWKPEPYDASRLVLGRRRV